MLAVPTDPCVPPRRHSVKLTDTDIGSLGLSARLGVRWRRAHGDPTSLVEAQELRELIGPSPLARAVHRLVILLSLATLAVSAYAWIDMTHSLEAERAAAERLVDRLFARMLPVPTGAGESP